MLEEYYEQNPLSTPAPPPPWPCHAPTMACKADDLHADNQHIAYLSDAEQKEILTASAAFDGPVPHLEVCLPNIMPWLLIRVSAESGQSLNNVGVLSFPLPLLADRLAAIRKELHEGSGLVVLRGLDISSLSTRGIFTAFGGLASHVSERRGRQSGGKMIGESACAHTPCTLYMYLYMARLLTIAAAC